MGHWRQFAEQFFSPGHWGGTATRHHSGSSASPPRSLLPCHVPPLRKRMTAPQPFRSLGLGWGRKAAEVGAGKSEARQASASSSSFNLEIFRFFNHEISSLRKDWLVKTGLHARLDFSCAPRSSGRFWSRETWGIHNLTLQIYLMTAE